MCVVGEAAHGRQAVEQFRRLRPDVTVVHLCEPPSPGPYSVAALRKEFPHCRVVVLSGARPGPEVWRALSAGVQSYLPRNVRPDQLLEAVRAVHRGQRYIHVSIASLLAESLAYPSLSKRELDVLRLIAQGVSNKRIGARLGVTEGTVKCHVNNILGKLSAGDRTHAVTNALRLGLLTLD
jgi:two-component system, NarL family, response regulator